MRRKEQGEGRESKGQWLRGCQRHGDKGFGFGEETLDTTQQK